jgi:hypothetical protein
VQQAVLEEPELRVVGVAEAPARVDDLVEYRLQLRRLRERA